MKTSLSLTSLLIDCDSKQNFNSDPYSQERLFKGIGVKVPLKMRFVNMTRLQPYSAFLLTILYVIFCVLIGTLLPQCMVDENSVEGKECGTEGHDDAVISWTTSFFLTGVFALMGFQLYRESSKKNFASISYALLSCAYLLKGLVARFYGNSGFDDGRGMAGFFMWTFVYYIFWALSALLFYFLIQAAWNEIDEGGFDCGIAESRILLALMLVSNLILTTGCLWAVFFSVKEVDDDYSHSDSGMSAIPITMIQAGQLLWHACYCLFLVAAAYIWRALARQRGLLVGGLSHSAAASGIILSQVVNVGILLFYALDAVGDDTEWGAYNSHTLATVTFNYAMMMSVYFAKNFLLALFPRDLLVHSDQAGNKMTHTDSDETDDYDVEADRKRQSLHDQSEADDDELVQEDHLAIIYKDTENDTVLYAAQADDEMRVYEYRETSLDRSS